MDAATTGIDPKLILTGALALALAISEFLSLFPKVKSNGIFQLIGRIISLFTNKGK